MSEVADKLFEMEEQPEEEQEEEKQESGFIVDDDTKAEWCLEMIQDHREAIEKWSAHYDAEKKRVCMKHENAIVRLEQKLKGFLFEMSQKGLTRETKTEEAYNLPSGKIFMKRQEPTYKFDNDKLVEWAKQNVPDLVKVEESVDWAKLKKLLTPDGNQMITVEDAEVVPGIEVVTRPDTFKVKVEAK